MILYRCPRTSGYFVNPLISLEGCNFLYHLKMDYLLHLILMPLLRTANSHSQTKAYLNEISHGSGRCGRGGRGGHGGQGGGRCDGGTGMHRSRFFKKLGLNSRSCGLLKIG